MSNLAINNPEDKPSNAFVKVGLSLSKKELSFMLH